MKTLIDIQNEVANKETTPSVNWDELAPIQQRLLGNIVAIEYAKQFQDELLKDRELFFNILLEGGTLETTAEIIKLKIIMIDNLLKK
jgi:hypothetical protein